MIELNDIKNLEVYLANSLIDSEQIIHEYYMIPVIKYSDLLNLIKEKRKEDS